MKFRILCSLLLMISLCYFQGACSKEDPTPPPPVDAPVQNRELPKLAQNFMHETNRPKPRYVPDFGFRETDPMKEPEKTETTEEEPLVD